MDTDRLACMTLNIYSLPAPDRDNTLSSGCGLNIAFSIIPDAATNWQD